MTAEAVVISERSQSSLKEVAIAFTAFAAVWTLYVVLTWNLNLLPEAVRPWFRAIIWLAATFAWTAWVRPTAPCKWLGLSPITLRQLWLTLVVFAVIAGWNLVRVRYLMPPANRLSSLTYVAAAWSFLGVFIEELFFRGAMQARLQERFSPIWAIVLTSVLFLAIHVPGWLLLSMQVNPVIVVSVFLIGLICCILRYWSKSLWPGVAAHWAHNLGTLL